MVLAITTIVIGIAFSVLSLVTKQYRAIQNTYETRSNILLMKQRLLIDFDQSTLIKTTEQGITLTKGEQELAYEYYEDRIIREQDTIYIGVKDITYFYAGKLVESGVIDAVKLEVSATGNPLYLFVSKTLDSKTKLIADGN